MKFLIADDEQLVRISVMNALNDLGISNEDICQADCGAKILEVLRETSVDLAFIDIKMPDISGLDAIRQCLTLAPSTSFYILTGFGTFEYAAEAIRLGVKDFILKPLDVQTLVNILCREQAYMESKNSNIRESYAAIIKSILLEENHRENPQDLFCLPCYCTRDNGLSPDLEVLYQAESMYSSIKTIIIPKSHCFYIAFCTTSSQYAGAIVSDLRNLLEQCLAQQENGFLTLFCVSAFVPCSRIGHTFTQLQHFSCIRITHGINRLYVYNEKFSGSREQNHHLPALLSAYQKAYMGGHYLECAEAGRKFLAEMDQLKLYENKSQLRHLNRYFSITFPAWSGQLSSPDDFSSCFTMLTDSLLTRVKTKEFDISLVLSYIQQHYAEDISIHELATEYHVSPNYLSSRFHKETNIRFTDYLTNLRVIRATQLLAETNLQIKEIASLVGYYTASHFIRTFVKAKNITPAEYRNKMKQTEKT